MMIYPKAWPSLHLDELVNLTPTTIQIHAAVQLIAMAGKYFLPHQADDSHTNMGWDIAEQRFYGHPFGAQGQMQLAVHPATMQVLLLDNGRSAAHFSLPGRCLSDAVSWVKKVLPKYNVNADKFAIDLHYELPDYGLLKGEPFEPVTEKDYLAFSKARTIGQLVMTSCARAFEHATPVRSWPHHFDIGAYIPLEVKDGQPLKSITIGLAIADDYVGEYYFYITNWAKSEAISYDNLPELPVGGYWNEKHWTGAVLPLSKIANYPTEEQIANVAFFMRAAMEASVGLLGI